MKKTLVAAALAACCLAPAGPAPAAIGANEVAPAATLLLPYFEVDLNNPGGVNTLFTVANASASAGVLHATLWTDLGVPTYTFDIYLTGFDAETVDLRLLFQGIIPGSADAGADPTDHLSPHGSISQDINFPGSIPPCATSAIPRLTPAQVTDLQNAHTGLASSIGTGWSANCGAQSIGDGIARGFVTLDSVNQCTLDYPTTPGYPSGALDSRNIWIGEFLILDRANNASIGDPLVHVEASTSDPRVTNPAAHTFYGWARGYAGASDNREPLPTTWNSRYVDGGPFNGGTDLLVWRAPIAPVATFACGGSAAGFPLAQRNLTAFDEEENPIIPAAGSYFPVIAQRVPVSTLNTYYSFGFLHLDLKRGSSPSFTATDGVGQSWVVTDFRATGRFAIGFAARALDNALVPTTSGPGF